MIGKVLFIIASFYLVVIINGCCNDDPKDCEWIGFQASIIENSGKSPVLWQKNEINKKAFGIRISVVELFSDITQAK
ncbi:MAG: hypothetical protein LBH92_02495, partial [Bacteroidales bacterium]|nr:hypothetical protein [Bacteroidales bacterium]